MGAYTNVNKTSQATGGKIKPPTMRVAQAAHIVDKNSRTQVKLCHLIELLNSLKSNSKNDITEESLKETEFKISKKIVKLQQRLNRRLQKLAKWADHPSDSRWKDLQPPRIRPVQLGRPSGGQKSSSSSTSKVITFPTTLSSTATGTGAGNTIVATPFTGQYVSSTKPIVSTSTSLYSKPLIPNKTIISYPSSVIQK